MTEKMKFNLDLSYARLPEIFYTHLSPTPVQNPELVLFNHDLAELLGLNGDALTGREGVAVLAGNKIPAGSKPLAQAYAGHQFGNFTMLGDGRALLIGEQITPVGERYDIQWKGSGPTPYSRRGDGRAALGPMLREYIISEGMHGLGIKTSRSLAVVKTGEPVFRDKVLAGAVLTRIASSHLRVGTFEYAAAKGGPEGVKALADYAIQRHFPHAGLSGSDRENYLAFFHEVIKGQASLIAKWQLVGFVHGVMNTDNMTVSGETIDYGPCAFIDAYNRKAVFSSIDSYGRYAYGNQPKIGAWNLARLAEAILPLLHEDESQGVRLAEEALDHYFDLYHRYWLAGMKDKLGLVNEEDGDEGLIEELLKLMEQHGVDYTNFFRALTLNLNDMGLFHTGEFINWHEKWQRRLERQGIEQGAVYKGMKAANPAVIPRNHRVEEALAAAEEGDYSVLKKLLQVLTDPYAYSPTQTEYAALPAGQSCPYRTFCGT